MGQFKTIFWDNDGTLVDTEPLYFEATKAALKKAGIDLLRTWYVNEMFKKGGSPFDLARKAGIPEEDIQRFRMVRDEAYSESLRTNVGVIDGVRDTLEALHRKVPMGVVTLSYRNHFDQVMEASGLRKYFDFFICGEDVVHGKPHPEGYLQAWERSGFAKEECLVIEDTERGVTAAKAAGLACFACPTEFSRSNDFSRADKVIGSVREILPYFDLEEKS